MTPHQFKHDSDAKPLRRGGVIQMKDEGAVILTDLALGKID